MRAIAATGRDALLQNQEMLRYYESHFPPGRHDIYISSECYSVHPAAPVVFKKGSAFAPIASRLLGRLLESGIWTHWIHASSDKPKVSVPVRHGVPSIWLASSGLVAANRFGLPAAQHFQHAGAGSVAYLTGGLRSRSVLSSFLHS